MGGNDKSVLPRCLTFYLTAVAMASKCYFNTVMWKNSFVALLSLTLLQALGQGHFQMPLIPTVPRQVTIKHLELLYRDKVV